MRERAFHLPGSARRRVAARLKKHAALAAIAALLLGSTRLQAATLQSIAVTPANPSIAKGLTQQFTATGTFSDNSTQNLTAQVTWASATTATATINSSGLATALRRGPVRSAPPWAP